MISHRMFLLLVIAMVLACTNLFVRYTLILVHSHHISHTTTTKKEKKTFSCPTFESIIDTSSASSMKSFNMKEMHGIWKLSLA